MGYGIEGKKRGVKTYILIKAKKLKTIFIYIYIIFFDFLRINYILRYLIISVSMMNVRYVLLTYDYDTRFTFYYF